jgi:hypothetical protein
MVALPFDLFWRDHGVSRGLQGLGKDASTSRKHVETLGDHGKKLAGAFAGFAAVEVFKGFIDDARESAKISRITENVIRSTGGAAHVTADQVGDLATALSNKTGQDDEAIQSGANMLLTFTNIRNEVGKGNDIFNQAAGAAEDMAAAMNNGEVTTDGMKTASIQLGKALNDPIKGVTALQKVGVTFTAQQKAQIRTLVESGRTMDAQKIILAELNKEFGGTAKAAADPMQRLSVIMGNLGEQVGGALLPAMNDFADFMANTGAPALSTFVGVLEDIPAPAYAVIAGLVGITGAVKAGHVVLDSYRQVTDAAGAAMKLLGLRTGEAVAAETLQAGAAGRAAGATDAMGLSAGRAGLAMSALAKAAGVVALAAVAQQVQGWSANAMSAKVPTDALTQSMLQLGKTGQITGAGLDVFKEGWGPFSQDVHTSGEAMARFGDLAKGAIGGANESFTEMIGRQLDGTSRMGELTSITEQYDRALSGMVQGGSVTEAKAAFAALSKAATDQGVDIQEVNKLFPQYTAAVAEAGAADASAAGQSKQLTAATRQHGSTLKDLLDAYPKYKDTVLAAAGATSADKAETVQLTSAQARQVKAAVTLKAATDELTGALDANKNATLQLRGGEAAWYSALDATRQALKDNGRTLDVHTTKGRANRQALDSLASSGLSYLGVIQQNEGAGKHFKQTLDVQWQKLYDAARRFGATKAEARKYANEIYNVPKALAVKVTTPGMPAARAGARGLAADIAHINGRTVTVRYQADGRVLIQARGSTVTARATGGRIPGWSPSKTADNVPVMATAGEHMWSVDEVNAAGGHAAVERLRAAARGGELRLARGGAVNRHVTTRYAGRFQQGIMTDFIDRWAAGWATSIGGGGGGGGPVPSGSGVARWGPMVHRALSVVGLAQSLWDNWMRQIASESGGNPNAVQGNIGDVNNRSGDLAKGLLQVIGATFRAYHWPGTSWSPFDPWANMTTAMNYGKHRYPNLEAVIGHGHGYDQGGLLKPGVTLVRNGTGRPERVLTPMQTAAYERNYARVGARGGGVVVNVTMNLDPSARAFEDQVVKAIDHATRVGRLDRTIRRAS